MTESKDIQDARADELSRIKRPADRLTPRQRNRILNALQKALEKRERAFFEQVIVHELGFAPGSDRYVRAMNLWDEHYEE